jgi:ParB family transcriptional regulator, chromosome partitioning protein
VVDVAKSAKPDRQSVFGSILGNLGDLAQSDPLLGLEHAPLNAVSMALLDYNPSQPRRYHDPEAHANLVRSVREHGVVQPITVRPQGDRFEVIAGERRARAAREIGALTIPAVVIEADDATALEIATLENMAREDLNPVEETEAVLYLLEVKLGEARDRVIWLLRQLDNEARERSTSNVGAREREVIRTVFAAIGKFTPQSFVNNRLPILKYPPDVLDAVMRRGLPFRTAKPIASLNDPTQRAELIDRTIRDGLTKEAVATEVQHRKSRPMPKRIANLEERLGVIRRRVRGASPEKAKAALKLIAELEALFTD